MRRPGTSVMGISLTKDDGFINKFLLLFEFYSFKFITVIYRFNAAARVLLTALPRTVHAAASMAPWIPTNKITKISGLVQPRDAQVPDIISIVEEKDQRAHKKYSV